MNKNLSSAIVFLAGAAAGAFGTFIFMNARVQKQMKEVEEARNEYLNRKHETTKRQEEKREYDSIITENQYESSASKSENCDPRAPVVIDPYECGYELDYEKVELTYYPKTGNVRNEDNDILEPDEIEMDIGREALNSFGEYEEDSVYVRNDSQERYYIILLAPDDED